VAPAPDAGLFEVWPENWEVWAFFIEHMQTQWRVGTAGPVGIDYNVLPWIFRLQEVKDEKALFEGLKTIETAILKVWSEEAAAA
jgi:hypothetical protein